MIKNHPRIAVLVSALLLVVIVVAIFDPLRVFFCQSKIKGTFNVSEYTAVRWIQQQAA